MNFKTMDEDSALSLVTILLVVGCGVFNMIAIFYRTEPYNDNDYAAYRDIV
jgi:hypothetical protein